MKFPDKYPEVLQTLVSVIAEQLIQRGSEEAEAEAIAFAASEEVRQVFGGQELYIARGAYMLSERDKEIYAAYSKEKEELLARRYDMTVRRLQIIVARVRAEDRKTRQAELTL